MSILSNPDVQGLIFTLVGYLWLTHVQAAMPPWLLDRIPPRLRAALQALAGNWGNATNTQAPVGPASPLAALAITAVCAVLALGPAFLARQAAPVAAPMVTAPVAPLPVDPTATALAQVATPVEPVAPATDTEAR